MTLNIRVFIKYIELILAMPMIWFNKNCTSLVTPNYCITNLKQIPTQIKFLDEGKSNKTAYAFLTEKV